MHLLVTRPEPEAARFAAVLRTAGHQASVAPLLTIEALPPPEADLLRGLDALAVTSARTLTVFAPAALLDLPLFAVGEATAKAARAAGFRQVQAAGGDALALSRLLRQRLPRASRILHPGGVHQARDLHALLEGSGLVLIAQPVYRARAVASLPDAACAALSDEGLEGVSFFSPRTAKTFVSLTLESGLQRRLPSLFAFCLSPAVAAGLAGSQWRAIQIAPQPTAEALLKTIDAQSCEGGRA
ncbi:MAG: uroporphyrinogen-III synthase [Pseudomonadota bacterium]